MLFVVEERRPWRGSEGKSGRRRGTRKSESPREPSSGRPVRASASATSLSVALENHLKPSSVYFGPYGSNSPPATGVAIVSVRDTSDPPPRYIVSVRVERGL